MGEYAEMMLDGTLCEACGTFIDFDGGDGLPRYCSNQCARDRGALHALPNPTTSTPNPKKANCPLCNKAVKKTGLADHVRDAHGMTVQDAEIERANPGYHLFTAGFCAALGVKREADLSENSASNLSIAWANRT